MKNKKALRLIVIVISLFILTVPMAAASEKVLNIAVQADPDSFDPTRSVAAATVEIAFNIYEGLVKANEYGELEAALATHWEIDPSQTVYTFYLRDAYFHNGQKVTVDDVVNAINRARDPQIGQKAGEYQAIESVYGEDNRVIVKLRAPHGPLIYEFADLAMAIYPKDAANLANQPIGTGPYKFVEWRPNQSIKLARFDEHWADAKPYFEEVNFRIIPDDHSAILNLKTGFVDLIPRLDASLLHQVEGDPRINVLAAPMNLVQLLVINNQDPILKDLRVRQAIALAIDREEIIFGAAWGNGDPIYTGLSPAMPKFYNDSLEDVYPYDPDRAKKLLAEAGYDKLEFTFYLPAQYSLHVNTGEIIAEQLNRVGIKANIEIIDWGTWLDKVYTQRDYQLSIVGLTGKLDPHAILVRYTSDSSRNFFNFDNQEYDRIIAEAIDAPDEQRVQLYRQAQKIMTENVAGVFIMDPSQLVITSKDLKGWKNYPIYVIDVAALYR